MRKTSILVFAVVVLTTATLADRAEAGRFVWDGTIYQDFRVKTNQNEEAVNLVDKCLNNNNYNGAINECTQAIAAAPDDRQIVSAGYYFRGRALMKLGELGKALIDLNSAIKFNSNLRNAYYIRAGLNKQLGNAAEAKADSAQAEKQEKYRDAADEKMQMALGLLFKNHPKKALVVLRKVIRDFPDTESALQAKALIPVATLPTYDYRAWSVLANATKRLGDAANFSYSGYEKNCIGTLIIGDNMQVAYNCDFGITDIKLPVGVTQELASVKGVSGSKLTLNRMLPFVAWLSKVYATDRADNTDSKGEAEALNGLGVVNILGQTYKQDDTSVLKQLASLYFQRARK